MKLYFYKNGQKVGVSSRAFDVIEQKELMRAWILNFKLDNKNPMRKFVAPGAMFEIDGQLFDIYSFHQNTGASNATDVTAEHVSYRLNNYILPPMYSFMGTPAQILADMLDKAVDSKGNKASSEFSVGTCADLGSKAFSLGNEQEVTIRSATLGLQAIGVEVSYNNFKIDLPVKIGTETGRTFKFGVDLVSIDRRWAVGDGFTYDIAIATIGRLPGAQPWETFSLGDNVKVQDDIIGDTIERRIVCYTKCHDNPAKDQITLGVFIRDSATNAVEMKASINTKITEGQAYNGNRINRTEGFVSETDDGQKKVTMSGTDGFVCWVYENGQWVKKSWLDEMGIAAGRLIDPDGKAYAVIGLDGYDYGMRLYRAGFSEPFISFYEGWQNSSFSEKYSGFRIVNNTGNRVIYGNDENTYLRSPNGKAEFAAFGNSNVHMIFTSSTTSTAIFCSDGKILFYKDGFFGDTRNVTISGTTLKFIDGIFAGTA